MIRSFRDSETERLCRREPVRKPPPDVRRVALRKLVLLDAAETLEDLRVPPGNRAGQHSVRINDQWRVCFRWKDGDAEDVEMVDYH